MEKVIFDIDGVLLSEKRYFDVSALTVWEWYCSPLYMNILPEPVRADLTEDKIDSLRARFWKDDELLSWLKGHGINNNWDMVHAHIVTTLWLLLEQYVKTNGSVSLPELSSPSEVQCLGKLLQGIALPEAGQVLERLDTIVPAQADKNGVFSILQTTLGAALGEQAARWASLDSSLWQLHFACFQNWYFGDELYAQTYGDVPYNPGKEGFLRREEPLGSISAIRDMFRELKRRGYEIAIASGRSQMEMQIPFETYGWLSEFDPFYISTDTDVVAAEQQLGLSLDKPNPFAYYLGAFGKDRSRYQEYVDHPDRFKQGTYYVVGDSLSDVWCAKAMGAVMIGTLTGLEGKAAKEMFEREGAEYIVDSVLDILGILTGPATDRFE